MKKQTSFIIFIIAVSIFVFGLTYWYAVGKVLRVCEKTIDDEFSSLCIEHKVGEADTEYTHSDVALMVRNIRMKIHDSMGFYQWTYGCILLSAVSLSLAFVSLYFYKKDVFKGNK